MKKYTLINFFLTIAVGFILVCSYKEGPALDDGWECTGAETDNSNPAGCSTGKGCHATSATSGITVAIELDSAGIPTTHYVGGMNYTVKLTGVNTTSSNLPAFGFQIGSVAGTVTSATPTPAGTWPTPYPANTHLAPVPAKYYMVPVVEQGTQLPPTTGTGSTGTTYVETLNWTAPVAGTGVISIWAALNAVNDNGTNDAGDLWNTNHVIINEWGAVGIENITNDLQVKTYPNPFSVSTTFTFGNELTNATLYMYNMSGEEVKRISFSGKQLIFARTGIPTGIYFYNIVNKEQSIKTGELIIQ
ncbi:MAG TPA: T9SS type A sorting domain-containing protein [Bacteroidia bacterium]|jgi:hypothetical protein|nr:T9SS type A sorting domain-containing protein [Bacteroidia bacterium]